MENLTQRHDQQAFNPKDEQICEDVALIFAETAAPHLDCELCGDFHVDGFHPLPMFDADWEA